MTLWQKDKKGGENSAVKLNLVIEILRHHSVNREYSYPFFPGNTSSQIIITRGGYNKRCSRIIDLSNCTFFYVRSKTVVIF